MMKDGQDENAALVTHQLRAPAPAAAPRVRGRTNQFPTAPLMALVLAIGLVGGAVLLAIWPDPVGIVLVLTLAFGGVIAALLLVLRRRARALQRTELLVGAVEQDQRGSLIFGPDGRVAHANPAFSALSGTQASAVAEFAAVLTRRAAGPDAAAEIERLQRSATLGRPDQAEVPLRTQAGGREWRTLTVTPLTDSGVMWTIADITDRREVEAARVSSERLLEDFLENQPVGFFAADGDGRFVYVNGLLAQWLGIDPGETIGRDQHLHDFVIPEPEPDGDAERDASASSAWPGGSTSADFAASGRVTLRGGNGEVFRAFVLRSDYEDRDGTVVYSRSIVLRDLGPVESLAAANREWEQRFRALFSDAPVGIVVLSVDGMVMECNRTFLKMLGLHREGVVGRLLEERISKEDRADLAGQLSKVLMRTMPAAHLDVRMPATREREIMASVFGSRIEDLDGECTGLILHFTDTTQRRNLELQFAQAQKVQSVGQLAGGIAHDFNNLLTAMIGFCDLLLGRHGAGDPSFNDIMQIKQNANRATNLVRQLLAFSRRQTLQPRVLNAADALSDLSNLLRRLIGENIDLIMENGRDLGLIRVDPGQFDQVIINLAVNARDAMPKGGTLTIRTQAVSVEDSIERGSDIMPSGDYLRIDVADTGTGIAKEDIGRIFEPFFSTKEVGAGTGLGLSTVYGIVRQTDGFVFVDSAPGEGTTFTIYLPAHDGDETAVREAREAREPSIDLTGDATILLVEDEDAVRMFVNRALTNKGYSVLEADNGEAALEIVKGHAGQIDLVVSDVVMPGMDGHALIQFLREERPGLKVILISGYAEDAIPAEIGNDSTLNFLNKPFSLIDLATRVKDVLNT